MASLSGSVTITASPTYSGTNSVSTPTVSPQISQTITFTNGTGSNQGNLLYYNQRTVTGAAETIDLTTLTDVYGTTLSWAKVKAIILINTATTAGYILTVGAAASNAWVGGSTANAGPLVDTTDKVVIGSGGVMYFSSPVDGFSVSGTSKNLKVDPGANTITYTLAILGNA